MNEILMGAILDMASFLELSDENVVRADAAVKQLDVLSATLDELTPHDKELFKAFLERRILMEQNGRNSTAYLSFLQSFVEDLEEDVLEE